MNFKMCFIFILFITMMEIAQQNDEEAVNVVNPAWSGYENPIKFF